MKIPSISTFLDTDRITMRDASNTTTDNTENKDDLAAFNAARRKSALLWIGMAAIGAVVFGLVTWMLGVGPFAYRAFLYDRAELYMLNMTAEPVFITLDGGTPIEVGTEAALREPMYGGTTTVVTRKADGAILEEVEVTTKDGHPALYNVAGAKCLVLSDVSSFYIDNKGGYTKVLEKYKQGQRIINLPNSRVVWPRKTLVDQVKSADEGVSWIEMVACPLLDDEENRVLSAHLDTILTERKRKQREAEIKREMMRRGGSEKVDEMVAPQKEALEKKEEEKKEATPEAPEEKAETPDAGVDGAP